MAASSATLAKLETLKGRLSKVYERKREETETVIEIGAEAIAGGIYGALDQRYGTSAVFGMSTPLVGGVLLTGAALAGYGGSMRPLILAAGRAGLVCETYRRGGEMYVEWANRDASRLGGGV